MHRTHSLTGYCHSVNSTRISVWEIRGTRSRRAHYFVAEMLESARNRLLATALARQAEAEAEKREHCVAVTASGQVLGGSALAVDPEQLNTPSARAARLVANVAHTLVVCIHASV